MLFNFTSLKPLLECQASVWDGSHIHGRLHWHVGFDGLLGLTGFYESVCFTSSISRRATILSMFFNIDAEPVCASKLDQFRRPNLRLL